MTITSKDNEKLKLVRRLAERKHREREGLFVTEGEDLLAAGRGAGREPELLLTEAGAGLGGDEVERAALGCGLDARVGLAGDGRLGGQRWAEGAAAALRLSSTAWGTLGTSGRSSGLRTRSARRRSPSIRIRRIRMSPKAVRASMGSVFTVALTRCEVAATPEPRAGMVAHGGAWPPADAPRTLCLGAEREGLSGEAAAACGRAMDHPALRRGRVAGRGRRGGDRAGADIVARRWDS